jgi:hypothetical protein
VTIKKFFFCILKERMAVDQQQPDQKIAQDSNLIFLRMPSVFRKIGFLNKC